jgi:hypothetical protein
MAMLPSGRQRLSAEIDNLIDSHPSLTASLEDFEHDDTMRSSPMFGIPSQHSGFGAPSESEPESEPAAPWSPPAWRKTASGWYNNNRFTSNSRSPSHESRHSSYESAGSRYYGQEDEGDITLPANIPLPVSPEKTSPRSTAEPEGDEGRFGSPAPLMVAESREASIAPPDHAPNNCKRNTNTC